MKVVFLGTNGWFDSVTGNTICTLIDSEDRYLFLDAGNGISKADRFMKDDKPVDIFLSHFHLDHIAGLHTLAKLDLRCGLRIFGQPGTQKNLDHLINKPYTIPLDELPYNAATFDLEEGIHLLPNIVECRALVHSSTCFGYRFELDGKVIAYCTDTSPCVNAVKLAKDADLLITECSLKPGQKTPGWPHMNPEDAVKIASEARAKKLALTHFDAGIYNSREEREEIKKEHPYVVVAHDCLSLHV